MFQFTRRQRRRWSLPLMAVMVLHWCLGFGAALADVICLEPDGKVTVEFSGKLCCDPTKAKAESKHCIDLAMDDEHANHEPAPASDIKLPPLPTITIPTLTLPIAPPPLITASSIPGWSSPPPFFYQSAPLRAMTVLLI
ncbi:hypothetical protein [Agitococcus lubricus]|uniref:Uncharacterized protein n=1 Tax=Agitococcus lubricus TaxID=1077255 RepID=A0A2T5ITF4_9GAMM|nr:hypothetical protein [Agitococcus lubricus]PTQ87149.1 hypothetical protein C8N29_12215 [Agitococcus lubricus]HNE33660.1 hypothetical protein [Nitrospira sp.]HNM19789.1 hypothetical protein [Nitrospira sp.]